MQILKKLLNLNKSLNSYISQKLSKIQQKKIKKNSLTNRQYKESAKLKKNLKKNRWSEIKLITHCS